MKDINIEKTKIDRKDKKYMNKYLKGAGILTNNLYIIPIFIAIIGTAIQYLFLGGFVYLGYWLVSKFIN